MIKLIPRAWSWIKIHALEGHGLRVENKASRLLEVAMVAFSLTISMSIGTCASAGDRVRVVDLDPCPCEDNNPHQTLGMVR